MRNRFNIYVLHQHLQSLGQLCHTLNENRPVHAFHSVFTYLREESNAYLSEGLEIFEQCRMTFQEEEVQNHIEDLIKACEKVATLYKDEYTRAKERWEPAHYDLRQSVEKLIVLTLCKAILYKMLTREEEIIELLIKASEMFYGPLYNIAAPQTDQTFEIWKGRIGKLGPPPHQEKRYHPLKDDFPGPKPYPFSQEEDLRDAYEACQTYSKLEDEFIALLDTLGLPKWKKQIVYQLKKEDKEAIYHGLIYRVHVMRILSLDAAKPPWLEKVETID